MRRLVLIFLLITTLSVAEQWRGVAVIDSRDDGVKTTFGATYSKEQPSVSFNRSDLGSRVLVKNIMTGKSVEAIVTDYCEDSRYLAKISPKAANVIGFSAGFAEIVIDTVYDAVVTQPAVVDVTDEKKISVSIDKVFSDGVKSLPLPNIFQPLPESAVSIAVPLENVEELAVVEVNYPHTEVMASLPMRTDYTVTPARQMVNVETSVADAKMFRLPKFVRVPTITEPISPQAEVNIYDSLEKGKVYIALASSASKTNIVQAYEDTKLFFKGASLVWRKSNGFYELAVGPVDEADLSEVTNTVRSYGFRSSYIFRAK